MQQKRKYWSCIKKDTDFYTLSKEKQIAILVTSGVYISNKVASSTKLDIMDGVMYLPDIRIEKLPSEDFKDEFYEYLLEIYKKDIDKYFYLFFIDFNDRIFGMEHISQKNLALEIFRDIYDKVDMKNINFPKVEISKNGIENVKEFNRFKKLKGIRSGFSSNLATFESLLAYLGGKEAYFTSDTFKKDETVLAMLDFESQLKVLISLNDRYQFIDDLVFSKIGKLKARYKRYQNLFVSFEAFYFTHNFIEELTEHKPSNIDSLHQALLELNLIVSTKESFIIYVNEEHAIPITKVRHYERDVNRTHDFRLRKIKENLKGLTL
jgi:hypothetical protein